MLNGNHLEETIKIFFCFRLCAADSEPGVVDSSSSFTNYDFGQSYLSFMSQFTNT